MELKLELNIYKVFIYIIIILNLHFFYLVDSSMLPFSDLCIVVEVLFFFVVYINNFTPTGYKYRFLILFAIVLVATSSVAAHSNFVGQPVFMGLRAQRHWLVALLMYFPISKLVKYGYIIKEELMDIVDNIGIILGVITIIQVLVGAGNIFMHVQNNTRYGNIRLYVSIKYFILSFFYHLRKVLTGDRIRIKSILMLALSIFIIVFVSQSRMQIVALFGASLLAIISQKNLSTRNMSIIVVTIIAVCLYSGTSAGENLWNLVTGNAIVEEDTSIYRDIGHTFYVKENTENVIKFIFGSGYANSDWDAAVRLSRLSENINYNDNGIYGLFYYYGFIFVIWTAILHFKLIKDGMHNGNSDIAYYLICGLFGIYSLLPYNYVSNISFAIVCAIIDSGRELQPVEDDREDE